MFKRNQRKSDTDLRGRRSLDAIRALAYARSSEQIPRQPPRPITPASSRPDSSLDLHRNVTGSSAHTSPRRHPRFSLLRFKNASDPSLGLKARDPNPPPLPTNHPIPPPAIITTSPTNDITTTSTSSSPAPIKRSGTMRLWRKEKQHKPSPSSRIPVSEPSSVRSSLSTRRLRGEDSSRNNSRGRLSRVTFNEPERLHTSSSSSAEPPPYDDHNSSLPLPGPRLSESSRSTVSSGDQTIAYSTTTTTHTTTTTTFFRMPRRKRKDAPLFPLPSKNTDKSSAPVHSDSDLTPQARRHSMVSTRSTGSPIKSQHDHPERPVSTMLAASSLNFTGPGVPILRSSSMASAHSANSSPTSPSHRNNSLRGRGRSSTMSSLDHGTSRTKTSFGGLLGRIRRDSEPMFGGVSRASSPQPQLALSAPGSSGASREMIIPERNDEDTPPIYLSKLFDAVSKSVVASLLARNGDSFHQDVLTAYMRTFDFENDPMDMSLRKLLMEVELPSETQQIDRVLQAFAERYHDCNPFVYQDPDQAYFIAFSLIMLHTDYFNKNNKHKMQKPDYIKNTTGSITKEGVSNDILECFYANIIYTPFIRMEDEYDINGEKIPPHRPKKGIFHRTINAYDGRRMKEPIDPYLLIIDDQLDLLRPNLKDVIPFEDPYSYSGTASRLNMAALHKAFFRSGVLQIVSARSRPDAFMNQATVDNPEGADPGVVEIKVTKVGILWRKDLKKKKARSPWQEWGAVLTGSQLYFFRNVSWVKNLMNQYEQHHKHGSGTPVIFKPALEQFKPDAQISTDDAVALLDKSYKKHKNAFAFIRHGGVQEYFIADSETEMNDWLAKLNYAATFRTAGVRMRGVFGGNYEGQRLRSLRRIDSVAGSSGSNSVQTPSGEVSIVRGNIDSKLAAEISAARREVVEQRIYDSEDRIAVANKELQAHLRNGRHLQILTPIQPRNREQVMMAAATLAAKLRWVRMEMWKLRCHRDILALDMEEERITMRDRDKRILALNSPSPSTAVRVSPLPSVQSSPIVRAISGGDSTPTQANFTSISNDDVSRISSHKSNPSGEFAQDKVIKDSASSTVPRSPSMASHGFKTEVSLPGTDDKSVDTTQSHRSPTPTISESSFAASVEQEDEEKEKEKEKEKPKEKEKLKGKEKESSRPNIRKSLQRTLRESQGLGHKKNKPSNEDPMTPEKKALTEEGLARGSGSFTVHGKKASVITFGSEWQNMSSEDRVRRKKAQVGSEVDANAETESLSSMLSFSRRGSTQAVQAFLKSEEGLQIPPQSLSRRGSHTTTSTDELPEVPEGPIIEGHLMAKLGTYPGSFPHESSEEIRVGTN